MIVRKSVILLGIFIIVLAVVVSALDKGGGGPPGSTGITSQPEFNSDQAVETADAMIGSYSGKSTSAQSFSPNLGTLTIPSGSQIDISNGDIKASTLDAAETSQGHFVSACSNAFLSRNGYITADACDQIEVGPLRFKNVKDVQVRGNQLIFSEASSGTTTSPTRITFPSLGQSTFKFDGDALRDAQLTFTNNSQTFNFQNPLAFDQGTTTNPLEVLDSDGDGIADSVERALGTNINSMDTDGDRLSDQQEFLRYTTKPTVQNTFPISINPPFTTDAGFVEWANEHVFEVEGTVVDHFRTVNAQPPFVWVDRDGDGITDVIESMLGLIGSFLLTTF